jgi:hypothetical protein
MTPESELYEFSNHLNIKLKVEEKTENYLLQIFHIFLQLLNKCKWKMLKALYEFFSVLTHNIEMKPRMDSIGLVRLDNYNRIKEYIICEAVMTRPKFKKTRQVSVSY